MKCSINVSCCYYWEQAGTATARMQPYFSIRFFCFLRPISACIYSTPSNKFFNSIQQTDINSIIWRNSFSWEYECRNRFSSGGDTKAGACPLSLECPTANLLSTHLLRLNFSVISSGKSPLMPSTEVSTLPLGYYSIYHSKCCHWLVILGEPCIL